MQIDVEYERLHDYFGHGENDAMKRLKAPSPACTPETSRVYWVAGRGLGE